MSEISPVLARIGSKLDEYVRKHAKETTVWGERKWSLTLVPTHDNARDVVAERARQGIDSTAFPKLTSDSCCQYDEAEVVIARGLPFPKVLCPTCDVRDCCSYRKRLQEAFDAQHAIATMQRGAYSKGEITLGRNIIILHETPIGMFRPTFATRHGLILVPVVAVMAQTRAIDRRDARFYHRLAKIAKQLELRLRRATATEEIELPEPADHVPGDCYAMLNQCIVEAKQTPPSEALRIALGAVLGELSGLYVTVDEVPDGKNPDGTVKHKPVNCIVAVSKTDLPRDAVVWVNDATANKEEIEAVTDRPVNDVTPRGRPLLQHPVVQVIPAKDVTKTRKPEELVDLFRGLLHDLKGKRVGLLTHKEYAEALPELVGSPYKEQVTMKSWFGGALARGSNQWLGRCDVLLVFGTPRVPSWAVRHHLLQLGKVDAAKMTKEQAGWGADWWLALTVTGKRRSVKTPHYKDHDWHAAYMSKTRSELIQAVGRGRGYLEEGIPVYVVTRENMAPAWEIDGRNGFLVADEGTFTPLSEGQCKVLACLSRDRRMPTVAVAIRVGLSKDRALQLLQGLEAAGRVRRIGERGGWVLAG